MADLRIEFQGFRYAKGYRLIPHNSLPAGYPPADLIVPNGGERIPLPPFEKFNTLYNIFANLKTPDQLFEFVGKFGLLTRARGHVSPPLGDSVPGCLRTARLFRDLLSNKLKGPKELASFFESQLLTKLLSSIPPELLTDAEKMGLPIDFKSVRWSQPVGRVELVADPLRGVRLSITPGTLIGALWWQLGLALAGNAKFRECRHCGAWFEAGPSTSRRADAEFCSHEHKIRFFSLKRTRGG